MTAEIAILNRTAVALAADSIVTLAGGMRPKTYDSAEKIFELSCHQPIALMIYNNAQFMNAPLEVLIRAFRRGLTTSEFSELVQVWPRFEQFLLEFKRDARDELDHFRSMLVAEVSELRAKLQNTMQERLGRRKRKGDEPLEEVFIGRCRERQRRAESRPLADGFLSDIAIEQFSETFGAAIDDTIAQTAAVIDLTDEVRSALHEMMFAIIRSDHRSSAYTGFVFAGFGSKEIFPTLNSVEVDGVYFGRFRLLTSQIVDIDRRGETAAVVPFAQKDMPERFIDGIDQEFESRLEDLANGLIASVINQNPEAYPGDTAKAAKEAAAKKFKEGLEQLKRKNSVELKSIVNYLSKKELAEVAYSLVELTSRKRRYSNAQENVGGPIDVAILTLNEGFVWVRRKHYFGAELNPRYQKRV